MNNRPTFREIYEEHVDMVFNLCLHYLQNTEDAEEVTQDVFVKIYHHQDNFRQEASLKTWAYRITINHCLDFLKAKKRLKRFGFLVALLGNESLTNSKEFAEFDHPGVQLEQKEAVENIFHHINQLPDTQKTALILKSVEGLPQKEIAAIMHLSPKAVESLLSRARATLKKKL